ncbi:MAG: DUF4105 domain-containing protein [Bdellovibrionales bacterium]|nr:DUF4105 domain-containing protein [Bdellovibrionales bacterium]
MSYAARFALLISILASSVGPVAGADLNSNNLSELASNPKWTALVHYRRTFFGAVRSEIDSPEFFLSPNGHDSPESELRASILELIEKRSPTDSALICRFPARYDWLRKALAIDSPAPEDLCPALNSKLKSFKEAQLTLIFAESYPTNPASMFGHSFMRFDSTSEARGSDLLAPVISFAAKTDDQKGFFFAFKGLTGLYKGVFFHAPYHVRVRQYNDLDRRNLWEYHLNFSADEIRQLVLHLWELEKSHFDYYFFDENCSYHLLGALDAARPELELRANFFLFAIPTDTVRVVTESPELLKSVTFRPSEATRLRQAEEQLNEVEVETVRQIVENPSVKNVEPFSTMSQAEQARVLETAVDFAAWRDKSAETILELQKARSDINLPRAIVYTEPKVRPDQGHYSSRVALEYGNENSTNYLGFVWRPAYHDLYDMPGGYLPASSLTFAETEFRYETAKDELRLESVNVIELESYSARSQLVEPWSWKIGGGIRRYYFDSEDKSLIIDGGGGLGVSYELPANMQLAVLLDSQLLYGGRFENNFELGLGASAALLADILPEKWRLGLVGESNYLVLGTDQLTFSVKLVQTVSISKSHALRVELGRLEELGRPVNSAGLQWIYYFY